MMFNIGRLLAAVAAVVALSMSASVAAADEAPVEIDAEAAETLARREDCLKCHGVEKSKEGPAFKKIAAKFKTKPDAAERVLKHIKSGDIVKLDNGDEEEHRIIKTTDEKELKNLIRWILSR
jgi:cytochrome c